MVWVGVGYVNVCWRHMLTYETTFRANVWGRYSLVGMTRNANVTGSNPAGIKKIHFLLCEEDY